MPAEMEEMEGYQPQAVAPSATVSEQIYTALLIIAAIFFVVALVFQYFEYAECYAERPAAESEVTE